MTALPVAQRRFAGLQSGTLGRRLVYFDSACTTPTPKEVATSIGDFYRQPPGCPLRSATSASNRVEARTQDARDSVRRLLNAKFSSEIVFTPNATFSINLVAGAFRERPGAVLISDAEHNSNRLPWLKQERVELRWPAGTSFPLDEYRALLKQRIKLVSLASVSNVTGAGIPVAEVVRAAHDAGVPVHIDASQQVTHRTIDIVNDRPDFLSFSLHKAYGPSGMGVLYVRRDLQPVFFPAFAGGGSVDAQHDDEVIYTPGPARFEYGLQNYAGQFAVPAAIQFLEQFSADEVRQHFQRLNASLRYRLSELPGVRFIGPSADKAAEAGSVCNICIDGTDSLRVAELLDNVGNVQVRVGQMCAHHHYHRYGHPPSIRVSFGYHNTEEEVEYYVDVLRSILRRFL